MPKRPAKGAKVKRKRKPPRVTKLGTKNAAIRRAIFKNPGVSTLEIQRLLEQANVDATTDRIYHVRSRMQKDFPEKRILFLTKSLNLTEAQTKQIPTFKRMINWALFKQIFPTLDWPTERMREFHEFMEAKIPRLIINYKPEKGSPATYVLERAKFLKKNFMAKHIKDGIGLKWKEVWLLLKIIREKSQGLEGHSQIAKKLKCRKKEVDELWEAYELFKRIRGRTGMRKEQ